VLRISGIASHFVPQIQANAMQQHFCITLIAMQITHGLSLYHQPICLRRLEAIEGWITADKNHIVFASPLASDTPVLHSHCGLLVASRGLCVVIWGISNAVFTNE